MRRLRPVGNSLSGDSDRFLAVGAVTQSDRLAIELVQRPDTPAAILIKWPPQPTVTDPADLTATIAAIMRVLGTAQIEMRPTTLQDRSRLSARLDASTKDQPSHRPMPRYPSQPRKQARLGSTGHARRSRLRGNYSFTDWPCRRTCTLVVGAMRTTCPAKAAAGRSLRSRRWGRPTGHQVPQCTGTARDA